MCKTHSFSRAFGWPNSKSEIKSVSADKAIPPIYNTCTAGYGLPRCSLCTGWARTSGWTSRWGSRNGQFVDWKKTWTFIEMLFFGDWEQENRPLTAYITVKNKSIHSYISKVVKQKQTLVYKTKLSFQKTRWLAAQTLSLFSHTLCWFLRPCNLDQPNPFI